MGLLEYRVEHRSEVTAGAVDDLEDFTRGRLLLVGLMQLGGQSPDGLVRCLGGRAWRRGKQIHRASRGAEHARLPLFRVAVVSRRAGFVSSISRRESGGLSPATRGCRPHSLSGRLAQPIDLDETRVSRVLSPIRPQHHPNRREAARRSAVADHDGPWATASASKASSPGSEVRSPR